VTAARTFNDTDRLQILAANKDSSSVRFLFSSDGSVWNRNDYATAAGPRDVVVADADGDGDLDFIVPCFTANKISILYGSEVGGMLRSDIAAGTNPSSVAVVNFDGDLKNDLVNVNQGGASVTWTPEAAIHDGWYYGDTFPTDFTAPNQFGDDTHFSGLRAGKWVLLDICSSWCHPCRDMAGHTQDFFARWAGNPTVQFEYVTVLVDGQTPGTASTQFDALGWSNTFHINRPVLHSGGSPVGGAGPGPDVVDGRNPTLRLIDPQGRIRWYSAGAAPESTIARVLANAAGVAIRRRCRLRRGIHRWHHVGGERKPERRPVLGPGLWFFVTAGPGYGENFLGGFSMVRDASGLGLVAELQVQPVWLHGLFLHPAADCGPVAVHALEPGARPRGPRSRERPRHRLCRGHAGRRAQPATRPAVHVVGRDAPHRSDSRRGARRAAADADLHDFAADEDREPGHGRAGRHDRCGRAARSRRTRRAGSQFAWSQPQAGVARLELYDLRGRHVRTLASGMVPAGEHVARWDLTDEEGAHVGAGLYFCARCRRGSGRATTRVTVLR
jgi:thiol-disulfide isomerase/thioredoxin